MAQTLALDVTIAKIRKSNLEKATFSNDQSYFAFAFFSNIDPMDLTWYLFNERVKGFMYFAVIKTC